MGKIIYYIMIFVLLVSCQKNATKEQQKVTEKQIEEITKTDSITIGDFGEHKSIHQIEWEEHREELDTLTINVNPK